VKLNHITENKAQLKENLQNRSRYRSQIIIIYNHTESKLSKEFTHTRTQKSYYTK
jgi:hypothetical protein